MPELLKVAAVSYFNARPLVEGLREDPGLHVLDLPPADAARGLLDGHADIGLVPCVTLLKDDDLTWLPGLCIGADGPVDSVFLYLRRGVQPRADRPLRIALDPHSRTSQRLTRIVLFDYMGLDPSQVEFLETSPRGLLADQKAAEPFDGILVIGDLALREAPQGDWQRIDLALAWREHTGLPFVFAIWGVRRETLRATPDLPERFMASLDAGMERIDTIVNVLAPQYGLSEDLARRYLCERIVFRMDERAERGLRKFLDACRVMED